MFLTSRCSPVGLEGAAPGTTLIPRVGASAECQAVEARVGAWVARHGLPRAAETVIVGCSGGADSTALLLARAALARGPLVAVYVDHGLRETSTADGDHVERLASDLDVAFARRTISINHGDVWLRSVSTKATPRAVCSSER